jgi:hypothetical protein
MSTQHELDNLYLTDNAMPTPFSRYIPLERSRSQATSNIKILSSLDSTTLQVLCHDDTLNVRLSNGITGIPCDFLDMQANGVTIASIPLRQGKFSHQRNGSSWPTVIHLSSV